MMAKPIRTLELHYPMIHYHWISLSLSLSFTITIINIIIVVVVVVVIKATPSNISITILYLQCQILNFQSQWINNLPRDQKNEVYQQEPSNHTKQLSVPNDNLGIVENSTKSFISNRKTLAFDQILRTNERESKSCNNITFFRRQPSIRASYITLE